MNKVKNRVKVHPPYYAIPAYQILSKKSPDEIAKMLGISVRTYKDKIIGYSDFKANEASKLCEILGKSMDEIFLT